MKTILITSYAINPYKGSEDGTGWNWVHELSKYNRIIAITRENNLPHIEKYLKENDCPDAARITFIGYDLPYYMRFWKRGGKGALLYFYLWQLTLPRFIQKLKLDIDLVHNLNFHTDWIPTFLWKLGKPTVWGPIGHHPKIPENYLTDYDWKALWMDRLRWGIKRLSWSGSKGIQRSIQNSSIILAMNSSVPKILPLGSKARIMPAVGTHDPGWDHPVQSKQFRILSIGRFVPLKGFDLALKAFAEFFHKIPPKAQKDVVFNLIGKGPLKAQLKQLANSLGIAPNVNFIEWMPKDQLDVLYRNTEVFLFPSHEGAGMVVPEAFSYGIPVICLNNIGPGEFITSDSGIGVSYNSPKESIQELAEGLAYLRNHPDEWKSFAYGARNRFETWFDWKVKAQLVNEMYSELLPEERPKIQAKSLPVSPII